jgi:hypothetical protein
MKIRVEIPWGYKGDVYDFTIEFVTWLEAELENRIIESEVFTTKYGKDWTLTFAWNTQRRIKQPKLSGHWIDRKNKKMRCMFDLPIFRRVPAEPKAYVPQIRQFLKEVAAFISREQIDASGIEKDIEQLLEQFCARPGMLKHDPHPYTFGTPDDPWGRKAKATASKTVTTKLKSPAKLVKQKPPKWKIPKNIQTRVDDEDGMWEDERFDPILLTVISGVEYEGREIPLSWQIEFDPFDDRLETANEKLEASGIEPDGDGWAEHIESKFSKRYPKLADELHSDSESSTCVLWVESEKACQKLIELVWSLIYPK